MAFAWSTEIDRAFEWFSCVYSGTIIISCLDIYMKIIMGLFSLQLYSSWSSECYLNIVVVNIVNIDYASLKILVTQRWDFSLILFRL